jgi:AcrR family transcriptional regulator
MDRQPSSDRTDAAAIPAHPGSDALFDADTMRGRIFAAFWKLYQRKPIEKIAVREIIALAPCNRSTFYAYFASTRDLLDQFEDELLADSDDLGLLSIIGKDHVYLSVAHMRALYQRYRNYYVALLGRRGDPAFRVKLETTLGDGIRRHLQHDDCAHAVDCNTNDKSTDSIDVQRRFNANDAQPNFELDYVIHQTASALISGLTFYYQREDRPSAETIVTLTVDLLNNGIAHKLGWDFSVK